ncbi:39S ribosomal protein L13, mitochondrial [Armadillidium nasatum]|uniref:39S ribosomal protein L13, mitochondrial n=1 Tax=Armadillidium nasatum TaxID=96803 RepID=A0A5N5SPZ4_9CRUS|nr:39S ribosomal protein L13, mitochondrial [Armadillidium nasatum]
MSLTRRTQQWATFGRTWYLYDMKWQNPFHSARKIAYVLSGRNKPIFEDRTDCGDHVVAINSRHISLPGNEWEKRVYYHHTGYPGGATWTLAHELHAKDPTIIVEKAVYSALDKDLTRHGRMRKLHIFPDDKVPEKIMQNVTHQLRQMRPVPVRLDHIPKDVVDNFPKIFDWPKDFVLK